MATYFRKNLKIAPIVFSLIFSLVPTARCEDDTDLTGCTVEIDSYLFNLLPLSHPEK